ncbi:plasmid mobilization relaxosome protein MobC [Acinetobacter boissieri]|uniref:Mobilisation protein (MobC) n=1 Tax=Acinetobacter boissieri TaxID=1219383 RepID=A0A1G6JS22_9GAMM|nr:plasmid mobilization relaxosome protein MobC [Acinetobacter boissieri]SDC20776.1 mobilisation protein (MobC) [Acinetobacter boissieri]
MLRKKTKSFRMTELQLEQLKNHLQTEKTEFSDFLHSLIQREIMQNAITVVQNNAEEIKPRIKVKTVFEVIKRYQKTDPELLLEIGKIGNNLNQIARALNIIKNADPQQQKQLDILNVMHVLKGIQTDLQQLAPALPKISRQSPERLQKQLLSIQLAEEDESAY